MSAPWCHRATTPGHPGGPGREAQLPATLAQHLGVEALTDEVVGVGHRPGRKLLTVVHTLLAGGDCIDDADISGRGRRARCWAMT